MESTRDIRRLIEREIKKGSAPLTFDHIDYRADALHEIQTESDLKRVLVYLFRIAEYAAGLDPDDFIFEEDNEDE
mgnify:CR=1 FL=1